MDTQDDLDPLLAMWVRAADSGAITGLEVTLMVGGLLVSGTLVGINQYLKGIANQFRKAPGAREGIGPAVADAIDSAAAERSEHEAPAEGDGDAGAEQDVQVRFVHLLDVHILNLQGDEAKAPLWRGRLTAVDGFIYGAAIPS